MAINFERLDATITYAVEHPERFDFGSWFEKTSCGTTACIAGTAAWLAGWEPVFDGEVVALAALAEDVVKDGERRYTYDLAAELLGLTDDQANELFVGAGGLRTAIKIRNEWAAEAGVPERTWSPA